MSKEVLTLDDLVRSRPKIEFGTAEVDVSHLFPDRGKVVFVYREPSDPANRFKMFKWLEDVRFQRPDWPEQLIETVAMLAAHHIKPEADRHNLVVLYCNLVETMTADQLQDLVLKFSEQFPGLANLEKAISDEKNA